MLPAFIRRMHLAKCLDAGDWDELTRVFEIEKRMVESRTSNAGRGETANVPPVTSHEDILSWLADSGISQSTLNDQSSTKLTCWGSGSPLREFLYSDDLAEACVFLLENINYSDVAFEDETGTVQSHVNVGSGKEVTIKGLAETVADVVGFQGEIEWDATRPDGTPRKLMDSSKLRNLGWKPEFDLREGIAQAYEDFKGRYCS